MATLTVAKPFTVQIEEPDAPGGPTKFTFPSPGVYSDVPDSVAQHPYTAPHLEGYVAPPASDTMDHVVMAPDPPPPPPAEGGMTQAQMAEAQRRAEQQARQAQAQSKSS